jgi:hypothetical protein
MAEAFVKTFKRDRVLKLFSGLDKRRDPWHILLN